MSENPMIEAEGLVKRYGDTLALDQVGLSVPRGTVLGMLGPNGAGKTTTVRVLTTLLVPDAGTARVAGFDVVAEAAQARRHIGVTGQNATLDELLTGRQNLVMMGELSRLSRAGSKAQADDLLERFDLTAAADRVVKGYSGGMRRRLDLAASLVARPPVLFLDEPTTGLDPTSRLGMWEIVRTLVADGVTVLLTTQYLDEADELADRIIVVDHGRVIAEGTPRELKDEVGGERLQLTLAEPDERATAVVAPFVVGEVFVGDDGRRLVGNVEPSPGLVTRLIRALDDAGIPVDEVEMHRPSLDDVFFTLTGRDPTEADADAVPDPDRVPDPDESAAA